MADDDYEAMDNFEVRVVARSRAAFDAAVTLAMREHKTVVAWAKDGEWIVFLWHVSGSDCFRRAGLFPCPLGGPTASAVAWVALRGATPVDKAPVIDGDVSVGFELQAGRLGDTAFRVRPIWAEHHK